MLRNFQFDSELFKSSIFLRSLRLFNKEKRVKIILVNFSQSVISFLDIVGVALLGIVGGLLVNQGKVLDNNSRIRSFLENLGLENLTFQYQIFIVGAISLFLLISKSIISLYLYKKSLYFFNLNSAALSQKLINQTLQLSVQDLHLNSIQKINYVTLNGPMNIGNLMSYYLSLFSDSFLTLTLLIGLSYVNGILTSILILSLGIVILIQYFIVRKKSEEYGKVRVETGLKASENLYTSVNLIRELRASGRVGNYINKIGTNVEMGSLNEARIAFLPLINKYTIEIMSVIFVFIIAAVQFSTESPIRAATTVTLFLAATSRLIPSLLRIQQSLISIKNAKGMTIETFEFIEKLGNFSKSTLPIVNLNLERFNFNSKIELKNIAFSYSKRQMFKLKIPELVISQGESVAIVGKSGSGKTSLVDVILGINSTLFGKVQISGLPPKEAIEKWPGSISYVPQNFLIFNGSIRENLCMGLEPNQISETKLYSALEKAQLSQFVRELPFGLDEFLGESGLNLSGGQRQRICIARALVSEPNILILDEATSALDSETEFDFINVLNSLMHSLTLVIVAHRLSTVRKCDRVVYMSNGEILASGSFEEVRSKIPDFDKQAELSGY